MLTLVSLITCFLLGATVSVAFKPSTSLSGFTRYRPSSLLQSSSSNHAETSVGSLTKTIFDRISAKERQTQQTGGAGGSVSYTGLLALDQAWNQLKSGAWAQTPRPIVFSKDETLSTSPDFDVVVCGGTLGIFYAAALQAKGKKVAVVERNKVAGRAQEWNISRKELLALIKLKVLSPDQIEQCVAIEFNPVRVGFKMDTSPSAVDKGFEVYVRDILNLGVYPDKLISLTKESFERLGGVVLENSALSAVNIYNNGVEVQYSTAAPGTTENKVTASLTAKLVLDAMGNASPIVKQMRGPLEPDGVCVVVGSCARGFPEFNNTYSDLIYADTPLQDMPEVYDNLQVQYFWEAFPAGSGPADRTTYLFTYMDAKPQRPSILEIMDDYWRLLPRYQGVSVEELDFQRILYGMFPTYRSSPIQPTFNRILPVGDASGIQSPLSFGGFGSLTRHLERIINSVEEALQEELLSAADLGKINPYMPSLSAYWMFQKAMSTPLHRKSSPSAVLGTLTNSFSAMEKLGDAVMRPFLQDVLQFEPLVKTLLLAAFQDPLTPMKVVPQVGLFAMGDFFYHFFLLAVYTWLAKYATAPVLAIANSGAASPQMRFHLKRTVEAWKFGSGLDYYDHEQQLAG